MLSSAHGVAVVLRTSLQLWSPAQDLRKIKPRSVLCPSGQHKVDAVGTKKKAKERK